MPRTVEFEIAQGNIALIEADVAVLKYAQAFYGADGLLATAIRAKTQPIQGLQPKVGEYQLIKTGGAIDATFALFVGVVSLPEFRYEQIREFSSMALAILAKEMPVTRHIAMTIHGIGAGLDETEALLSQFAGLLDALQVGKMPESLERISIVEIHIDAVKRLRRAMELHLAPWSYATRINDEQRWAYRLTFGSDEEEESPAPSAAQLPKPGRFQHPVHPLEKDPSEADEEVPTPDINRIETAGLQSEAKPHAFIAMPFKKEFDDIFYYGIQQPIHMAGLLCERVDKDAFSGGIMEYVKHRIETAAVVVAELTGANPNVYLEVGYAWGKGRPVILLVQDENQLHFDVKGQRCLVYERIKDLEEALSKELRGMMAKGIVTGQNAQ